MDHEVREDGQGEHSNSLRLKWRAPVLTEEDSAAITAITNCGSGSDGVICQAGS